MTLWERLRDRRAKGAGDLFHRPEPFLSTAGRNPRGAGVGIGGTVSAGPLTEDERQYCERRLRTAGERAWGTWPKLYRLEHVRGHWQASYYNSAADGRPSSIMREQYRQPFLCGRDAHRVKGSLGMPLGMMIRQWVGQYRQTQEAAQRLVAGQDTANDNTPADPDAMTCWVDGVRNRDLTDLEREFQERATSREVVKDLTHRAVVDSVVNHDFPWLKGPEGSGKTTALMENHEDILATLKAQDRPAMYAFICYERAEEKAAEFNAMQARKGGRYHAVVIRGWETEYGDVCRKLKLTPWTAGAALEAGYPSLWRAVEAEQPAVLAALEKRHREVWAEIGTRRPVFMTSHAVMQHWTMWTHTRKFWHRQFWFVWRNRTRDPERYRGLQHEMGLGLAVFDEVAASDLLVVRPEPVVDWVRGLKATTAWRKARGALDQYGAWDAYSDGAGFPQMGGVMVPVDFQEARRLAQGRDQDWRIVEVRDSGEYGPGGEHSIYTRVAGNRWGVRPWTWWAGLARRVVVTTTEMLPTLIASNLEPVTVLGRRHKAAWSVVELECPAIPQDMVRVRFDRACTAANIPAVIERFREEHGGDYVVISDRAGGVPDTVTHAGAKGSNLLIGRDLAQTMIHQGPEEFEYHEVLNAYLGVNVCVRLRHVDAFNQTAGRNLGFRKIGDDPHHWLIISPSLWLKIDEILTAYARYGFRLWTSSSDQREIKRRWSKQEGLDTAA